jgi:general stress protein 26
MQRTQLSGPLQTVLERTPYITLATVCADGQPWNSPVYARIDEQFHVFWVSWTKNQHSQNIARDPRIFVVIYDSQAPEGTGLGLYLQMRARVLTDIARINAVRHTAFNRRDTYPLVGNNPRRLYEAVPEKIWHNAQGREDGNYIDRRILLWQA